MYSQTSKLPRQEIQYDGHHMLHKGYLIVKARWSVLDEHRAHRGGSQTALGAVDSYPKFQILNFKF